MNKQNKFTRREINTLAKEQKIPYYHDYTKRDLMEKLGVKKLPEDVRRKVTPNVSRAELNLIARDRVLKNTMILRRNLVLNYQDQNEDNQTVRHVENHVKLKFGTQMEQ